MTSFKPVFAVIGKPNNGKSTIISALTFDDRVKVADEIGTTKELAQYKYTYQGQEICSFFDTPGFENSKEIWRYIEKKKALEIPVKEIFREFIEEFEGDDFFKKDIHILQAIVQSDFVIFVVDISKRFNKNTGVHELRIIKELQLKTVVLFNQLQKEKDYSTQWREELEKFDLTNIHTIDPLDSRYSNIEKIVHSLYSPKLNTFDTQEALENLLMAYKADFANKLESSAKKIASFLHEVLKIEIKTTTDESEIQNAKERIKELINEKEAKTQKELSQLWGYYEIEVEDKREHYDHKINKKIALSKKQKLLLDAMVGAVIGSAADLVIPGLGVTTGAGIGAGVGIFRGLFSDGEFLSLVVKNQKNVTITIDKKDVDLSVILITRIVEFVKTVVQHGHANREKVIVNKIEKLDFPINELKQIAQIHKALIKDVEAFENRIKLEYLIKKTLQREIRS